MMDKRMVRMAAILLGLILIPLVGIAEEVVFRVTVPGNSPAGESVFVVGNVPGLGEWDPGAVEMSSVGAGVWEIALDLTDGENLEYKYTRGGWGSVEKNLDGSEMDNRTAVVAQGLILEDEVARWADVKPEGKPRPRTAVEGEIAVTFRVTVPANTPEGEPIYISGDLPELGTWDGGFVEMSQVESNLWEAQVEFAGLGTAEYKYTRGDWGTVEKKADGGEADNHKVEIEPGTVIEDQVMAWADVPADAQGVTLISNTGLSSKVMVNGRYVSKYVSEQEPDDRFRLNRPSHDIRFDFLATAGPTISVWARASFFTGEHFHFSWDFDRAWARVHPEEFDLTAFYNEEIVSFDDPLHLVGHRDLRSTIWGEDIPFGRGTAGAQMLFHRLGTDFSAMVANVHDFDVRNDPDTFDEIGTDWVAFRASRPAGRFQVGLSGRRIRTANWASVFETFPPAPPADMNVDEFSNEWFELNDTDDIIALDLEAPKLGGVLDLTLGGGYQRWQATWALGNARERVTRGEHIKVDDEIGGSQGYVGLAKGTAHVFGHLTLSAGFRREFLDAPNEGDAYVAWVLKHKDDANQNTFPIGLPGHEREIDRTEGEIRWSGGWLDVGVSASVIDDNRRRFAVSSDRHASETRVMPEVLFHLGDRVETGFRYLYERGTRFGLSGDMGIPYAIQEWETGYRFRFASEKWKIDTRVFAADARLKLSKQWFWDFNYEFWNLWRDYKDDRSVEVDGAFGILFTAFTYEPREGIQVQFGWGVDPVDDEDDRLAGREALMRRGLTEWLYADDDGDGIKNYRERVDWIDDEPYPISAPTIGDLMRDLSDARQFLIKAKIGF